MRLANLDPARQRGRQISPGGFSMKLVAHPLQEFGAFGLARDLQALERAAELDINIELIGFGVEMSECSGPS
jgi:hypothetical protein